MIQMVLLSENNIDNENLMSFRCFFWLFFNALNIVRLFFLFGVHNSLTMHHLSLEILSVMFFFVWWRHGIFFPWFLFWLETLHKYQSQDSSFFSPLWINLILVVVQLIGYLLCADSGKDNFPKVFERKMEEKRKRLKESGRFL